MRAQVPNIAGLALIGFFVAFPFVYTGADYPYMMHILITGFFYAILASSWSMLAGYAGQFSFGHIGFMGIGAYTAALFSHYFWLASGPTGLCTEYQITEGTWLVIVNAIGVTSTTLTQDCLRQAMETLGGQVEFTRMPVWLGIVLGSLMGGVFGFLIGVLVLRLRAAYLALFTLGFAEILKATISATSSPAPTRSRPTSSCSGSCSSASPSWPGWRDRASASSCARCARTRTPPQPLASTRRATRCWSSP